jgi:pseudouridine-5'-phosphate glycosidase
VSGADPVLSEEVADGLADGRPVVALESTIITHGMPHPRNVETALAVEEAIRGGGAVPATIDVIDGDLCVGMTADTLTAFAARTDVAKLSRSDLAVCLATGGTGATTVAATMIAARRGGGWA